MTLVQSRLGGARRACRKCSPTWSPRWRAIRSSFWRWSTRSSSGDAGDPRDDATASTLLVRVERPGERAQPLPSTLEQLIADRLPRAAARSSISVVDWLAGRGRPLSDERHRRLAPLESAGARSRASSRAASATRRVTTSTSAIRSRATSLTLRWITYRASCARQLAGWAASSADGQLAKGPFGGHRRRGTWLDLATRAKQPPSTTWKLLLAARAGVPGAPGDSLLSARARALSGGRCSASSSPTKRWKRSYRTLGRRRERRKRLLALRFARAQSGGSGKWVALALVRTARLDLDEGFSPARPAERRRRARSSLRIRQRRARGRSAVDPERAPARARRHAERPGRLRPGAFASSPRGDVPLRAKARRCSRRARRSRRRSVRIREAVECYAEAIAAFRRACAAPAGSARQKTRSRSRCSS